MRYGALLLMSAHHAVSALYIHTTMSAAESFRTLSTIDQSAHCQIFDYKSDSSQNNTNGSCYFLDEVLFVLLIQGQQDAVSEQSCELQEKLTRLERDKTRKTELKRKNEIRAVKCHVSGHRNLHVSSLE